MTTIRAQDCTLMISGNVVDTDTHDGLRDANIFLEGTQNGTISDDEGYFEIKNLCEGDYHLVISHVGCEPHYLFVELYQDTILHLHLDHAHHVLEGAVVSGQSSKSTTQTVQVLNEQKILDDINENLALQLEDITGVSILRSGSSIAKPIVHGLYGNRLTILNNGIAQSGQQWGNDHSPEIDPLVANKIKVIKGVSGLEYPGSNLGAVILVEPKRIGNEPHLHGRVSYFFETNGLGHGLNAQIQQQLPRFSWKLNGTYKRSGDRSTPDYLLRNTGGQEANMALQLEKNWSDASSLNVYFSSFNTDLGVLRGSHIGNLTDLEAALQQEIPFFTSDTFTYRINPPKQKVGHQLAKLNLKHFLNDSQWLDFTAAAQFNNRKEFDVRRSGRSDIPALSIQQFTYFLEGKYQQEWDSGWSLKTGMQFNLIDNTNNPETGILPLIPDYYSYEVGTYAIARLKQRRLTYEFGARYDNIIQNVATFTDDVPREVVQYNEVYHNFGLSSGFNLKLNEHLSLDYNLGYASRNPGINELYSSGLHQGVSGIEEGDVNLVPEYALKSTLSLAGNVRERFSFESLLYYQDIRDYIFLRPTGDVRLTIRGAFPVFRYEQSHARIWGWDAMMFYQLNEPLSIKATYSFIQGDDLTNNEALIYIPSNQLSGVLKYNISKWKGLENLAFEITNKYVFRQDRITDEQDFVAPPDGYYLLGLETSTDIQFSKTRLRILFKVDNALNTRYRDYLNRQRYFADDWGVNATLGLTLRF